MSVKRGILRVGLAALASTASLSGPTMPAAAQVGNQFKAQVKFRWQGESPASIAEVNSVTGTIVRSPIGNPHVWDTTQRTPSPQSEIQLRYAKARYVFPFRSYRGAPMPQVEFARPAFSCAHADINRIEATLNASVKEKLTAMAAAGALYQEPPAICPDSAKKRLADLYYRLNCDLTSKQFYVGYLEEAENRYRKRWEGNPAKLQKIQECLMRSRALYVSAISNGLSGHIANSQFAAAHPLAQDIAALRQEPAWQPAFGDYSLAAADIRALELRLLHERQIAAQSAGDLPTADSLNETLQAAYKAGADAQAFQRAGLDLRRLQIDAANIRAAAAVALTRELVAGR